VTSIPHCAPVRGPVESIQEKRGFVLHVTSIPVTSIPHRAPVRGPVESIQETRFEFRAPRDQYSAPRTSQGPVECARQCMTLQTMCDIVCLPRFIRSCGTNGAPAKCWLCVAFVCPKFPAAPVSIPVENKNTRKTCDVFSVCRGLYQFYSLQVDHCKHTQANASPNFPAAPAFLLSVRSTQGNGVARLLRSS
jgi:hypothetical protein